MGNGIIVFDFDDVLVDLSTLMYRHIRENWRIYSKWFADKGELTTEEVLNRNIYNFSEWLIKKKFEDLTPGQYSSLQLIILETLKKEFFNKDPYLYAKPTEFAKRTLLNNNYIENKSIKKVYILSKNVTEGQDISKRKFIEKYFNNQKIEYISVDSRDSKADAMKKLNIEFDLFVDDLLSNIRDVAEKYKSLERKEFLIPSYGYNKMQPELDILIREKGATYSYFDMFKEE